MKFIVLILLIWSLTLEASGYIRSIRLGSFTNEAAAQATLHEAKKFLYSHKKFKNVAKKYHYKFKIKQSRGYYLLVLEPITDRHIVQELLDTLREKYPSTYPKRLKSMPKDEQNIELLFQGYKNQSTAAKEVNKRPKDEVKKVKIDKKSAPVPVQKMTQKGPEPKKPVQPKPTLVNTVDNSNTQTKEFVILSVILAVVIFFLLIVIIVLKRKNKSLKNKNEMMLFDVSNKTRKIHDKEKLLAHVSHEIRNPISTVLGLSQLILENDLPAFQKENVRNIENSSQKALELINNILNASSISRASVKVEYAEFNINSMLEHVLSNIYLQAKHNNVDVMLDIDEKVPSMVVGDSLHLGQVLINLLSNAVKFSPNGDVTLKIRKKEIYAWSVLLEFSVIDNGIGMSQQELENIFKTDLGSDDSLAQGYGTSGIGMSISKELVEKMGGKIKVRSQKNSGTTFVFTLEVQVKDVENQRNYHLPSEDYLNKNILIVESSNKNVISFLRAFRYFKYKTHVVPSIDSLILHEMMKFDIIVINQAQLSEDAIQKLQKMHFKNRAKTRIVLAAYRFTKIDDEVIEKLDISGFLKIPFTQQNVLDLLVDMYGVRQLNESVNINAIKEKLQAMDKKKILIAEDNILNHKVFSGLLAKTGIEMSFVTNGQEVLNLIKKGIKYDLILMDINMPVIDGYDATIEIRKDEKNNSIPIIGLSVNSSSEAIDKAFAVGMQGYISKPIVLDDFYKKIYDALAHEIKVNIDKRVEKKDAKSQLTTIKELEKLSGEDKFYKSLLVDFEKIYAKSASSLGTMIRENKYSEAIVLTKDIKDVALNIGAYTLCESATALEYALEREDSAMILKALNEYEEHLSKLLIELDEYLVQK